jgi:hypothetical protein
MNSFNDGVCEFNSTPITENFGNCAWNNIKDDTCPSGCRYYNRLSHIPGKCIP